MHPCMTQIRVAWTLAAAWKGCACFCIVRHDKSRGCSHGLCHKRWSSWDAMDKPSRIFLLLGRSCRPAPAAVAMHHLVVVPDSTMDSTVHLCTVVPSSAWHPSMPVPVTVFRLRILILTERSPPVCCIKENKQRYVLQEAEPRSI